MYIIFYICPNLSDMLDDYSNGLDLEKLKALSPLINKKAIIEELKKAPKSYYEFTTGEISTFCLNQVKSSLKVDLSPKVLSNWVKAKVANINKSDRGKIKRFSRLENIWLRIAVDLRSFGIPLKSLSYIREQLFSYDVEDFNSIKFKVLTSILGNLEYLIIDSNMQVGFYSYQRYSELSAKGYLLPHMTLRLIDYIRDEFENNLLDTSFSIENYQNDIDKLTLTYFIRTNDFESLKITVSPDDVRLIENATQLNQENSISKIIKEWDFESIEIQIDDSHVYTIINPNIIEEWSL